MSKMKSAAIAASVIALGAIGFASSASAGCGYVATVVGYNVYGYPIYGNSMVCTPDPVPAPTYYYIPPRVPTTIITTYP